MLDGADVVCPSGGVPLTIPLVVEAQKRGIPLSNDSQMFLEAAPCKVIGITGSAGKTTTTTLVGRMAQAATEKGSYRKAFVGGNIGSPLIAELGGMAENDLAIMELSSFQLEIMTCSPQIAVVLNITPNHLDRHKTMEAYANAKLNILKFQTSEDTAVLGMDEPNTWAARHLAMGRSLAFGRAPLPDGELGSYVKDDAVWLRTEEGEVEVVPTSEIQLRGEHNLLNVLAAVAIAGAADLPLEAMQAGIRGFSGVEHRLEFVRNWGGAAWYNDSIATAPERAIAAINSFEEPLVLLAGGRDKDLPWGDFAQLAAGRVDHIIAFGEAAQVVEKAMNGSPGSYTLTVCKNLAQAVETAADLVSEGDVVLLSPGGTSFDEFKDFAERGKKFKEMVNQL
jgi:UDP-N-acetylmuramoylalanine--D-glutamate ligase